MADWTFLTNHFHVLYCLAREPGLRLVEIADRVGIRERAAHRIVSELEENGYLTRHRLGSRNYYELHADVPLRHSLEGHVDVGELLSLMLGRRRLAEITAARLTEPSQVTEPSQL